MERMESQSHAISYLSPAMQVNMGDWWFEIASTKHFWIRRRFQVMNSLAGGLIRSSKCVAEIGCGNGLLQREIEDHYEKTVIGFDLNELALKKNVSRLSQLYCYDIHQRNPELQEKFDLMLLFDVLEHIENESEFLESLKFHLASSGALLINVPAHQSLYSDYDHAAGHVRRYSARQLTEVADRNGFKLRAYTYWGAPMLPLLLLRKTMRLDRSNGSAGFDSRGSFMNFMLSVLARCERIPQTFMGTSVMALFESNR